MKAGPAREIGTVPTGESGPGKDCIVRPWRRGFFVDSVRAVPVWFAAGFVQVLDFAANLLSGWVETRKMGSVFVAGHV